MAKVSKQQLREAIPLSNGNVTAIARSLGVSRETVYQWLKKDSVAAALLQEERDGFLDLCESKLRELVEAGDLRAIIFALRTLGRNRGYSERHEVLHAEMPVPVKAYIGISPDDWDEMQ